MKNIVRKLLCCLVAAMLLLTTMTAAVAEMGYEGMKYILAQTLENNGVSMEYNWSENSTLDAAAVTVVFNSDDNGVMLTGYNANGNQEVSMWTAEDLLSTFLALCGNWATIEGLLDDGYTLCLTYLGADAESSFFVTDEATATSLYQTALSLLEE